MPTKKTDPNNIFSLNLQFYQEFLADNIIIPGALLRDYSQVGLSEGELIIFLRVLGCFIRYQSLDKSHIAAEFDCSPRQAENILSPFVRKGLINIKTDEEDKECGYGFNGLFNELWESWSFAKSSGSFRRNSIAGVLKGGKSKESEERRKKQGQLYRLFEKEFGRGLSPLENEQISHWLEADNSGGELIEEALRRAVMQGKATFAYIDKILANWQQKHLTSLSEVQEKDLQPAYNKRGSAAKKASGDKNSAKNEFSAIYDKILGP
jgi:DNA replication protein